MKTIHYIINRSNITIDTAMIIIELAIKSAEFEDFGDVVGKSLNIGEDDGATICMQREKERERERERERENRYKRDIFSGNACITYSQSI